MKKIILALLSLTIFSSCSTTRLTTKKSKTIEVAIDLNNVVDDKVQVFVNPKKINDKSVVYQIPAIVPGTYVISDYGKFIVDFKAYDYNGNEMSVQKTDTNSWQIDNAQQLDKVSYWVEDTFDTKKNHEIYIMAGTNIEEGKNFLLNLPGFIGYFKGKKEYPYQIAISHPKNLYETSSLINKNSSSTANTNDVFVASRYDEISDNPIMYAPKNSVNFNVNGIDVTLSVYSPNRVHSAKNIEKDLKTMVEAQTNFLEGFETTDEYNIIVYLFDPKVYKWGVYGALEHLSSTTVVYPETLTKERLINNVVNETISHEFFHIITPLSVHSEEIHNFNFNKPDMSKHLWMYEGITEYFANLFQVNQGLIDDQAFIDKMQKKIAISKQFNDTMSFTEMSTNVLESKYAKNYGNVYMKGALIGMCLDILLREESKGTYGIKDVMKDLSKKYGAKRPFNDDLIIDEITEMTYPSVGEFFKKHVLGNTPIDYSSFFEKVGVRMKTEMVNSTYFLDSRGSPFISLNNKQEIVFTKRMNTGLINLGIKSGDVLKSINDKEISIKNISDEINKSVKWKKGDSIKMVVVRDGKLISIQGKVINAASKLNSLKIERLPAESPKVKLRTAWLKG